MIARTPNVFIVGAGPVAAALAGALRHAGAPVLGLWGRRPDAVRRASAIAGVAGFSAAPPDLILEADVVVTAVRDDAIGQVARMLVDTGLITKRHVLLHCSGAMAAEEAFGSVRERVGGIGTLHPLRSIVDPKTAAMGMKGVVFGVEGDEVGRARAVDLARLLGGSVIDLRGETMAVYHAAASLASNALVALIDAAAEALTAAGLPSEQATAALLPLVLGTLENLGRVGLPAALTGPIARGDAATVERHLGALAERAPALLEIYRVAARRIVAVSRRKGEAPGEALDRIERALEVNR